MAGDWIKMRGNLWDDPRIAGMCDATGQTEATIIGALYWLWASADQHTEDGFLPNLTVGAIDRKTGISGFAVALLSCSWLQETDGGLIIPRFLEHNGASAKRRCMEASRKASARNADKMRTPCGQNAPKSGHHAELEKSKSIEKEKDNTSSKDDDVIVRKRTRFTPPTIEQVTAYCAERSRLGNPLVDAQRFHSYYLSNGWRVGKNPMRDWQAAVRQWERNTSHQPQNQSPQILRTQSVQQWEDTF